MPSTHATLLEVTERIRRRSAPTRMPYLERLDSRRSAGRARAALGCSNAAHAFAAAPADQKILLRELRAPNLAIVSSYNDMLSAHQPYEHAPALLREGARLAGGVAQFAGGVPAMCDGITQGREGMELSLFSRDTIAMATAIALSHEAFDAGVLLGVCDKIVPGLLIGALHFGELPFVFVPAGPMSSGLGNAEKAKIRQLHAQGKASRDDLLAAEMQAYHGAGTCTFYGTANSNQMLMEVMGLHLPGAAFVSPATPLRDALTREAARRALQLTASGSGYTPIGRLVDERALANAIVGLLATGGSTNHTIHLIAIARAAGIVLNWDDFDALSRVVPLVARVYPNGSADVNHFHAAGGVAFVIRELLGAGLLHEDVLTVAGPGLSRYTEEPVLHEGQLSWRAGTVQSLDTNILRPASDPFSRDGGLKLLDGPLGRAVIKISAVAPEHRRVSAPALVFDDQEQVLAAYRAGELRRDFIAVVRFQGPRANGMPELHSLTPLLGALQDEGFHVALVTDGRMSGASGKVPAAIHVTPEVAAGGALGRVRSGDPLVLDAEAGVLTHGVDAAEWAARAPAERPATNTALGCGRELFAAARERVNGAESGATTF